MQNVGLPPYLTGRIRRELLKLGALAAASRFCAPALAQNAAGRVVVIGGGFAGATCARALKRLDPRLSVTLVEPNAEYTACPFSNLVIAGLRDLREQRFGYDRPRRRGRTGRAEHHRGRSALPRRHARRRHPPLLRPPDRGARHRF